MSKHTKEEAQIMVEWADKSLSGNLVWGVPTKAQMGCIQMWEEVKLKWEMIRDTAEK